MDKVPYSRTASIARWRLRKQQEVERQALLHRAKDEDADVLHEADDQDVAYALDTLDISLDTPIVRDMAGSPPPHQAHQAIPR